MECLRLPCAHQIRQDVWRTKQIGIMNSATSRRTFLKQLAVASAITTTGLGRLRAAAPAWNEMPIAIFEKVFEALNYEELADAVARTGADGIEATIRANGHIKPAVAADEVPKMNEALRQRGRRIVIAATDVRGADDPESERLLRVLQANGVTHYRLGHYQYDLGKPMPEQVANYAAQAKDVAAMNKAIGIQGLYQNHSGGRYLGALGWDAVWTLQGIEPDAFGLALDTRHLIKDTGSSWKTAVAACKPHIRSIYVKDGMWHGPRGDQYKDVALDTGFVNSGIFNEIRRGLKPMPLCIHMEWLGYRVFLKNEIPAAIEAHQRDLATLRRWMKE